MERFICIFVDFDPYLDVVQEFIFVDEKASLMHADNMIHLLSCRLYIITHMEDGRMEAN